MTEMSQQERAKRVVIAGGSGFLGLSLSEHLAERGYEVVVLSRSAPSRSGPWRHEPWDGLTVGDWKRSLDGAVGLVNLAGRTVDCIKSPDHCDEILRSRVESTRALGRALRDVTAPPPVWVQMATAHRYGDPESVVCDEDSAFGYGFAPVVGEAWEAAYAEAVLPTMRQVVLRTSFVLGRNGGALGRLSQLARFGLGGRVGHGRQGISWIHQRDMDRLFERSLFDETMVGAYIATAPKPVSNAEFMRSLRRTLRQPIGLPASKLMVRFGARFVLKTDPEMALYGRFCVSRRLREQGFEFEFEDVEPALEDLLAD